MSYTNDENIRNEIMAFIESIVDSPSDLLKILSNLVIKNHQLVIGFQSNADGQCGISTLIRLLEGVCRDDVKNFREETGLKQMHFKWLEKGYSIIVALKYGSKFITVVNHACMVHIVKFPYTFTNEPVWPNEKMMDSTLKAKFGTEKYIEQFMHILVSYL